MSTGMQIRVSLNTMKGLYKRANIVMDVEDSGKVVLTEKVLPRGRRCKKSSRIKLPYKGKDFAIQGLDGRKNPLFHFLDDNGKEWSKRCDFVVFQYFNRRLWFTV